MATLLFSTPSDEITPARAAALEVLKTIEHVGNTMIEGQRSAFRGVWHNPKATPAEILAEMGSEAARVFKNGADLVEFLITKGIASFESDAEYKSPVPYVVHDDGTVTIKENSGSQGE